MKKKPKVTFKRCNKKEWKTDPNYTVFVNGNEYGYIYFFEDNKEVTLEVCERFDSGTVGCSLSSGRYWGEFGSFFSIEDMDIFPIIRKKMIEFKKEVYPESKRN